MDLRRLVRHLLADNWALRRSFPGSVLDNIELAIVAEEKRHGGEMRFAVEGGLPLGNLVRGQTPRERAIELFGALRVWDTEQNCGVLVYLSLGDRDVEIVADRGIQQKVGNEGWQAICDRMRRDFHERRFEHGAIEGIRAISKLLAQHFPRHAQDVNELPDRPIVL
jgi:uncharacterized membrane protein